MVIAGLSGLLMLLATAVWVQFLPGHLLGRLLIPEPRGARRLAYSLALGFSVIPLGLFLLGSLWGQLLTARYLLGSACLINVLCGAAVALRHRSSGAGSPLLDLSSKDVIGLLAASLATTLLLLLGFRNIDAGDVLTTIQHCLYVISLHGIQSDPSTSLSLFDAMTGQDMHFLIHHDAKRLGGLMQLLFEQRLGNVPLLSPHVALHGSLGWLTATVHGALLVGYATFMMMRAAGAQRIIAVLVAAGLIFSAQLLCAYYLNENLFALAMVCFLMWVALDRSERSKREAWGALIVAGLIAGHLVGVRHTSVLFLPGLVAGVLWVGSIKAGDVQGTDRATNARRMRWASTLVLLLCILATTAPWLLTNAAMMDSALAHPKVQPGTDGRVALQSLWGYQFWFKTLNWPVAETWVRTPWSPFPTSLWLPLLVLRTTGLLAAAAAILGLTELVRNKAGRNIVLLSLFFLPHWLALSLLEGLDWEQISYVVPSLAPLAVLVGLGLQRWLRLGQRWTQERSTVIKEAIIITACMCLLATAQSLLSHARFPVDERLISSSDLSVESPSPGPEQATAFQGDKGVAAVRRYLSTPTLLPKIPHLRSDGARRSWQDLTHSSQPAQRSSSTGRELYPSGQLTVLSAYYKGTPRSYDFALSGRTLRDEEDSVRTAVWLHTVSVRLPTTEVQVHVDRRRDRYNIDLRPSGEATEAEQDFTFWLNPWDPPVRTIRLTVNGMPIPDLRVLTYGGELDEGERLHILTNYSNDVLGVVDVPYTIQTEEPVGCGIWVFLEGVDSEQIETLSPGGAFDMRWDGSLSGTLSLPKNLHADHVVLFSDPYCGAHVPQRGDRYGIALAPFSPEQPMQIELNRQW
jgi:hypothetical protein